MLIDTHAHLFWDSFKDDLDRVLDRAIAAGITTIINVGVDVPLSQKALAQAEQISKLSVYSTIGIHPHEVLRLSANWRIAQDKQLGFDVSIQQDINKLEEIYRSNPKKVVGVGECGLDYLFREEELRSANISTDQVKALQIQLFQAQINLAKKLDLPLLVHCRDDRSKDSQNTEAWMECLDMIAGYKGILHCYSGTLPITQRTMNNELTNFLISFAGNITYPKNDYLREAAKMLPLEKIVLETDCPFLAPQSIRGKRNEPSSVLEIAQLIAELKEVSFDEVANQTTENVKNLFRLG